MVVMAVSGRNVMTGEFIRAASQIERDARNPGLKSRYSSGPLATLRVDHERADT